MEDKKDMENYFDVIIVDSTDYNTALKLLVFICLFNRSNCFIPLNSILIK